MSTHKLIGGISLLRLITDPKKDDVPVPLPPKIPEIKPKGQAQPIPPSPPKLKEIDKGAKGKMEILPPETEEEKQEAKEKAKKEVAIAFTEMKKLSKLERFPGIDEREYKDLVLPRRILGVGNYTPIIGDAAIRAIGYGTDHRDNPLGLMEFKRRAPRDSDVVIEIKYCGICHSDWHVILDEWKNTRYPVIPGHEITGIVIAIGLAVRKFKVGDSVGLGPAYNSCRRCEQCLSSNVQYCLNDLTETYNFPDRLGDELKPTGPVTHGGYSTVIVADQHYVFSIPQDAPLEKIAPLLCAGLTMWTPLITIGVDSKNKVGIIGIGGLGHIGVKLAKALGATVIAFTHTAEKLQDIRALGADDVVLSSDLKRMKEYEGKLDLIIDTIPFNHDLTMYINLVRPAGVFWNIGSLMVMATDFELLGRMNIAIKGSILGSLQDSQDLINFCVERGIYPEVKLIGASEINDTHRKIVESEVRYRYVIDISTITQT